MLCDVFAHLDTPSVLGINSVGINQNIGTYSPSHILFQFSWLISSDGGLEIVEIVGGPIAQDGSATPERYCVDSPIAVPEDGVTMSDGTTLPAHKGSSFLTLFSGHDGLDGSFLAEEIHLYQTCECESLSPVPSAATITEEAEGTSVSPTSPIDIGIGEFIKTHSIEFSWKHGSDFDTEVVDIAPNSQGCGEVYVQRPPAGIGFDALDTGTAFFTFEWTNIVFADLGDRRHLDPGDPLLISTGDVRYAETCYSQIREAKVQATEEDLANVVLPRVDGDGNNLIDQVENNWFFAIMIGRDLTTEESDSVFSLLDTDGNGQIDANEFQAQYNSYSKDNVETFRVAYPLLPVPQVSMALGILPDMLDGTQDELIDLQFEYSVPNELDCTTMTRHDCQLQIVLEVWSNEVGRTHNVAVITPPYRKGAAPMVWVENRICESDEDCRNQSQDDYRVYSVRATAVFILPNHPSQQQRHGMASVDVIVAKQSAPRSQSIGKKSNCGDGKKGRARPSENGGPSSAAIPCVIGSDIAGPLFLVAKARLSGGSLATTSY